MESCVGYLHERLVDGLYSIAYEDTNKMAADAYTKGFTYAAKWRSLLPLIGIYDPVNLDSMPTTAIQEVIGESDKGGTTPDPPVATGGGNTTSPEDVADTACAQCVPCESHTTLLSVFPQGNCGK